MPRPILPNRNNQQLAADRDLFATFANVDFQRIRFWCLTAAIAIDIPRRLGPDAERVELTVDKKISRRVCNLYRELWRLFYLDLDAPEPPNWNDMSIMMRDPVMERVGSTVNWKTQVPYLIVVVERRMHALVEHDELATLDRMRRWYNKRSDFLNLELNRLYKVAKYIGDAEEDLRNKSGSSITAPIGGQYAP